MNRSLFTLGALGALLFLAAPASAQTCTGTPPNTQCTGPVTTATRFVFTAPDNAPTVALAQSLEYRVRVDGATTTFDALLNVTCSIVPPATLPECRGIPPAALVQRMNVLGSHVVTMSGFLAGVGEGPSAIPFALSSPPAAPTGLRILPGQ